MLTKEEKTDCIKKACKNKDDTGSSEVQVTLLTKQIQKKTKQKRFLEYLEVGLGRSQKTVENYDRALCVFLKYSKIKKASEITQNSRF